MMELFFMSIDVLSYIVWDAWIDYFIRIFALISLVGLFVYLASRVNFEEDEDN
jgi:hypothetical protein|tara:strand:+ start:1276 stop:1434 length:159 start_codon:yes stop_codon:yes gene_type:complete